MKQIFNNQYITSFKFIHHKDVAVFISHQNIKNVLTLEETFGDNYYCYVFYDSLTREKKFIISFSSDDAESELNLLRWEAADRLVLDTGKFLYLIDNDFIIRGCFDISSPLIGLQLTSKNRLLVLEEASLRLINSEGQILINELFDLIEDFFVSDSYFLIKTSEGNRKFSLS